MQASQDFILREIQNIKHLIGKLLKTNTLDEIQMLFEQTNKDTDFYYFELKEKADIHIFESVNEENYVADLSSLYTGMFRLSEKYKIASEDLSRHQNLLERSIFFTQLYIESSKTYNQEVTNNNAFLHSIEANAKGCN